IQFAFIPIDGSESQEAIADVVGKHFAQAAFFHIQKNDAADVIIREKRDEQGEAIEVAAMLHILMAAISGHKKAHTIVEIADFRIEIGGLKNHLRAGHGAKIADGN